MDKINGGKAAIGGYFETIEEAQKLASILNFKALPTSVNIDK
jgi:preprotein translocase subunit SecD